MAIRVEFYGIARQRIQLSEAKIDVPNGEMTLQDVLAFIDATVPGCGGELLENGRLPQPLAANLDGERFVSDPATPIRDGQCLLILSADAGG